MPTKRTRRAHGIGLTEGIIAILGMGSGISHMPESELRALWKRYGAEVTAHWKRQFGEDEEPFVAVLAREENWD